MSRIKDRWLYFHNLLQSCLRYELEGRLLEWTVELLTGEVTHIT